MWVGLQVWGPITGKDSEQGWPERGASQERNLTLAFAMKIEGKLKVTPRFRGSISDQFQTE